jgi:hypothetical protein
LQQYFFGRPIEDDDDDDDDDNNNNNNNKGKDKVLPATGHEDPEGE